MDLLYRHECFTGKYTTRKIHTKLHPGLEWRIFHILTSEDIDDFTAIKFVSKLFLIRWCMIETSSGLPRKSSATFGSSSKVFGNLQKSLKHFGKCLVFGRVFESLPKSSENGRKRSEIRQKLRPQDVYEIERT